MFAKSFEALRNETKHLEREMHTLKEKFKEKMLETDHLYSSLQTAEKTV